MSLATFRNEPDDWPRRPPSRSGRVSLEIPLDLQAGAATTAAVTQNISPTGRSSRHRGCSRLACG